jgi:predicted nucleic acid-binding protein
VKCFLDTNIFMYAAGQEHPLKAPCVGILRRVASEELEAVTSTEVLQEILSRYGAVGSFHGTLQDLLKQRVQTLTLSASTRRNRLVERRSYPNDESP